MTTSIHILCGAELSQQELEQISKTVTSLFHLPVMTERSVLDTANAFDDSRGQYHSTILIGQILTTRQTVHDKWIAIVDVDLYIPVLTFVFGEAQFDGPVAIVSTQRLKNKFYGMQEDENIFIRRLEKEIVHELGHTFGLYHCHQFECVMRSSTYVEEIDLKLTALCSSCTTLLHQHDNTNFSKG